MNINKYSNINVDELDQKYYLKSLINVAYFKKMISDDDLFKIQVNSMNLLKKVVGMLTGNESFTVKYDRARELLESSYFTVGIYLKTLIPDDALEEVLSNDWNQLYKKGNDLINDYLNKYKKFYYLLKSNMLKIANYNYLDTILNEIDMFFKHYNKDFDADNKIILGEYPLCFKNPNLLGIEFIMSYMDSLNKENLFLQKLDLNDINNLITKITLKDELVNIYEKVLFVLVGEELINHVEYHLNLTILEVEDIYMNLSIKTHEEIELIINSVINKIINKLDLNDTLKDYLWSHKDDVISTIIVNIENDTLDVLLGVKSINFDI